MKPHLGLLGLLALCACGPENIHIVSGNPMAQAMPSVALAEPVLLVELGALEPMDAFHEGVFVGNIWFSGGYELMAEEDNQVRSVGVALSDQLAYAEQVRTVVADGFAGLLTERGATWQPIEAPLLRAVRSPRRTTVRGSGPFDGRDNQNLPRFDLQPMPLEAASLPQLPQGTQAVLVPLVVQYYTHNGGWFVGQGNGCAAGARMRVLWALHDADDGRVLPGGEIGVQHQQEYHYSPNVAELQDYQLIVEAAWLERLDEQFPR